MSRPDHPTPPPGYLLGVLRDGAIGFAYRTGVRSLLGVPAPIVAVADAPPAPGPHFEYARRAAMRQVEPAAGLGAPPAALDRPPPLTAAELVPGARFAERVEAASPATTLPAPDSSSPLDPPALRPQTPPVSGEPLRAPPSEPGGAVEPPTARPAAAAPSRTPGNAGSQHASAPAASGPPSTVAPADRAVLEVPGSTLAPAPPTPLAPALRAQGEASSAPRTAADAPPTPTAADAPPTPTAADTPPATTDPPATPRFPSPVPSLAGRQAPPAVPLPRQEVASPPAGGAATTVEPSLVTLRPVAAPRPESAAPSPRRAQAPIASSDLAAGELVSLPVTAAVMPSRRPELAVGPIRELDAPAPAGPAPRPAATAATPQDAPVAVNPQSYGASAPVPPAFWERRLGRVRPRILR